MTFFCWAKTWRSLNQPPLFQLSKSYKNKNKNKNGLDVNFVSQKVTKDVVDLSTTGMNGLKDE